MIFLSYSQNDIQEVESLRTYLEAKGVQVWWDKGRIYGGDSWPQRIGEAVQECDFFVLVWSRNADASHYVESEWNTALALHKVIIPYLLDDTPLPPALIAKNGVHAPEQILASLQRSMDDRIGLEPNGRSVSAQQPSFNQGLSSDQVPGITKRAAGTVWTVALALLISLGTVYVFSDSLSINRLFGSKGAPEEAIASRAITDHLPSEKPEEGGGVNPLDPDSFSRSDIDFEPRTVKNLTENDSDSPLDDNATDSQYDGRPSLESEKDSISGAGMLPVDIYWTITFEKSWSWHPDDLEVIINDEDLQITGGSDKGIVKVLAKETQEPVQVITKRKGQICAMHRIIVRQDTIVRFCN